MAYAYQLIKSVFNELLIFFKAKFGHYYTHSHSTVGPVSGIPLFG